MARGNRRVVLFDATAKPRILPVMWRVGSIVDGARSYGVRSWEEAYATLRAHQDSHGPIRELQIWSHGQHRGPLIAGATPDLPRLAAAAGRHLSYVWFRACDVARNPSFMIRAVAAFGCDVVAHAKVISAPLPWEQRAICALRPGEDPWWDPSGAGLRSCSALRMTVPAFAYRQGPAA